MQPLAYPVVSRSLTWHGWSFPVWSRAALFIFILLVLWGLNFHVLEEPFFPFVRQIGDGVWVFLIELFVSILLLLFYGAGISRRISQTTIHQDRMEILCREPTPRIYRWQDILPNPQAQHDVYLESDSRPRSLIFFIRFEQNRQGVRETVLLPLGLHGDQSMGLGRGYVNANEVRYAFLVSMLRARPDLKISDAVFFLCGVNPRTLDYSAVRKKAWVAMLLANVVFGLSVLTALVFSPIFSQSPSAHFVAWAIAGILAAAALWGAFWFLTEYGLKRMFGRADDPAVIRDRWRALGVDFVERHEPAADAILSGKGDELERWVTMLAQSPAMATDDVLHRFRFRHWQALLEKSPRFIESCPIEIPEMTWSDILTLRPELASRCPWDDFDGDTWAFLLLDHPEFEERCDKWDQIDGNRWGYLLEKYPQWQEHCDFSNFDGWDWQEILIQHPRLAEHCDWNKLDEEEWQELLAERPEFADMKPPHIQVD